MEQQSNQNDQATADAIMKVVTMADQQATAKEAIEQALTKPDVMTGNYPDWTRVDGIDINDHPLFCISNVRDLGEMVSGNPNATCQAFFMPKSKYVNRQNEDQTVALIGSVSFCGVDIATGKMSLLQFNEGDTTSVIFGGNARACDITGDSPGIILSEENPLRANGVNAVYTMDMPNLSSALVNAASYNAALLLGINVNLRDKKYKFPSYFFSVNTQPKEERNIVYSVLYTMSMADLQGLLDAITKVPNPNGLTFSFLDIDLKQNFFEQAYDMSVEELDGLYTRHMFSLPYEKFKQFLQEEKKIGAASFAIIENLVFSMVMRIQMMLNYKEISPTLQRHEDKFI